MRTALIIPALSLSLLLVACDFVPLGAIQPGGKCHSVDDGSVLKSVEDINGKRWRVEQFPSGSLFATLTDDLCAVPVQARESAFIEPVHPFNKVYFLHPETGERIDASLWGSYQGYIDLDSGYEWY